MCRNLHTDSVYLHLYLWHSNNAHSIYVVPLSPTVVEAAVVLKKRLYLWISLGFVPMCA